MINHKEEGIAMTREKSGIIHALEFDCQSPLKFYEHCVSCAKFGEDCPELVLGIELLKGKKKLAYNIEPTSEDAIHISQFNCMAPIYYFEKSRRNCAHQGRCREEGLLLALLSGKKELAYTQKTATELPYLRKRYREAETEEVVGEEAISS
jgi:hypothetical protein